MKERKKIQKKEKGEEDKRERKEKWSPTFGGTWLRACHRKLSLSSRRLMKSVTDLGAPGS